MSEQIKDGLSGNHSDPRQAGETSLPRVTMNMLLDFLHSFDVEYYPKDIRRAFHWFGAIISGCVSCSIPPSVADANILYICSEEDALDLLQRKPQVFAIVLRKEDSEQSVDFKAYLNRIAIIKQAYDLPYYILQFQSYFTGLLVWENELSHIVSKHGTLTEMLDATTMVVDNFMFVSDASLNIIASSSLVNPPDELHRSIISAGRFTLEEIEDKQCRLPENEPYIKEPSELSPTTRLSRPIYLDHIYFGSLSMACCNTPLTEGLKDLFKTLMKYVTPLCAALWRTQVKLDSPHYFFFEKILTNTSLPEDYLQAQTKLVGIDESTEFALAALYMDSTNPARTVQMMRAMSGLNQGNAVCFPYQSNVLALYHSPKGDSALSLKKLALDITERICEPFDAVGGLSDPFANIRDLDLAYKQATLVLSLRKALAIEAFSENDGRPETRCRSFSEAIDYYLVSPGQKDERFLDFCFSNALLTKLHEEDQQNGTRNIVLLWTYLHLGRNVTAVANRLHMHRNTVLYHIEKIQKRFDLDLSSPVELARMMANFRAFFLRMGCMQSDFPLESAEQGLREDEQETR